MDKRLFVVDNFYSNPDDVRAFAMNVDYEDSSQWYKGKRSKEQYNLPGIQEAFEDVMNMKLKPLDGHGMCGKFQFLTAQDPIVYHYDTQQWAAMIYLTPDAPCSAGTGLYRYRETGACSDLDFSNQYDGYDMTKWDLVDKIGNRYNRLIIYRGDLYHASLDYFGNNLHNGRLFQTFFFCTENF